MFQNVSKRFKNVSKMFQNCFKNVSHCFEQAPPGVALVKGAAAYDLLKAGQVGSFLFSGFGHYELETLAQVAASHVKHSNLK
jgi:hypothetical protein